MKIINTTPEITFDDVLFLPQNATFSIENEKIIDLTSKISKKISINIPIVSSPMPGVTEEKMAIALGEMGGMGFIHSFQSIDRQLSQIKEVKKHKVRVAATIGDESKDSMENIEKLLKIGTDLICVFTYHSQNTQTLKFIKKIKKRFPKIQLNSGNVATKTAVRDLNSVGIDGIHVGIGPGSHCTTRLVTGIGRPQLSTILECSKEAKKYKIPIIADGGVKYPGDIPKALAFGASAVMIGGMFSGTEEAPGTIIYKDGKQYKETWGMCSNTAMTHQHLKTNNLYKEKFDQLKKIIKYILLLEKIRTPDSKRETLFEEGVEGLIEYRGYVKPIVEEFINGTRRSMWYQGATNIAELQKKALFVLTSQNTMIENSPRI